MNKDVIYIEPEDDITDIITKIENSKQKIVALVPPKKAGVFRSVVNIKLIAKAGVSSKKTVVLVTTDPSIVKLAGATKLPITKDLNSAPAVPDADMELEEEAKEEVVEEPEEEALEEAEESDEDEQDEEEQEAGQDEDTEEEEKPAKKASKKSDNKIVAWIKDHKKIVIPSGIGGVILIAVLVWALVFAPAVTIAVGIRTISNNFSESVSFADNLADEDVKEGRFHYEEKKLETMKEIEFEATGQKNVGEKAEGKVVVYKRFKDEGSVLIKAGSTFSVSGLTYIANDDVYIVSQGIDSCHESVSVGEYRRIGCVVSANVNVTAAEPGTRYNIPAKGESAGWDTTANVSVYSDTPMMGGTDDFKTIVSEADVEKAKGEASSENEAEMKEKLYETIDADTLLIIDSSFKIDTAEAVSTPAVGEEVGEGVKPMLKAVTTASVMVVDKTKIEEFIREKAKIEDNKKIYEIKSPFIENFMKTDDGYIGKLKTAYAVGPKVTENDVIEIIKGKGLGVAQHDLRDIDGVVEVKIDPSYPWVMSVPNNANKITVILEVKE